MNYRVMRKFASGTQQDDPRFEPFHSVNIERILNAHTEMVTRDVVRGLRDGVIKREDFFSIMDDLRQITHEAVRAMGPGGLAYGVVAGGYRYVIEALVKEDIGERRMSKSDILATLATMIIGEKYRIRYREDSQRYARQSVMAFLDLDGQLVQMSARPAAGTQSLPIAWIEHVEKVSHGTECYVARVIK